MKFLKQYGIFKYFYHYVILDVVNHYSYCYKISITY